MSILILEWAPANAAVVSAAVGAAVALIGASAAN